MLKPIIILTGLIVTNVSLPLLAQTSEDDCDPNYIGNCVPIASDVDCAGGKGYGPAYAWACLCCRIGHLRPRPRQGWRRLRISSDGH